MATLYIREFESAPVMAGGLLQIPNEPGIVNQTVSYTGTAGRSSAFNAKTKYIAITSEGIFSYAVGSSTIDATTSSFRVPAETILFMAVQPGGYISAIVNT